jgi:hypothetical protein
MIRVEFYLDCDGDCGIGLHILNPSRKDRHQERVMEIAFDNGWGYLYNTAEWICPRCIPKVRAAGRKVRVMESMEETDQTGRAV